MTVGRSATILLQALPYSCSVVIDPKTEAQMR